MKGILQVPGFGALSQRENEVLRLAAQGLTDVSICRSLGIAPGTLGTYWVRIRGKTTLTSRAELTAGHTQYKYEATLIDTIGVVAEKVGAYGGANEPRASEIFDALPVAALVLRPDGSLAACNTVAEALVGVSNSGRNVVLTQLVPRDVNGFQEGIAAALASDAVAHVKASVLSPRGVRNCNWVLKRLGREQEFVLALVSEPESMHAAVLVR